MPGGLTGKSVIADLRDPFNTVALSAPIRSQAIRLALLKTGGQSLIGGGVAAVLFLEWRYET